MGSVCVSINNNKSNKKVFGVEKTTKKTLSPKEYICGRISCLQTFPLSFHKSQWLTDYLFSLWTRIEFRSMTGRTVYSPENMFYP